MPEKARDGGGGILGGAVGGGGGAEKLTQLLLPARLRTESERVPPTSPPVAPAPGPSGGRRSSVVEVSPKIDREKDVTNEWKQGYGS